MAVRYAVGFTEDSPLGSRLSREGPLIKAGLADGRLLLYRAHPACRVEQRAVWADSLKGQPLGPPYPR